MQDLCGKNALLTGGSRGIGPAIAHALAQAGVNVALVARSADKLAVVAQEVSLRGVRVITIPADIADPAVWSALLARAEAELGPLDLLINNAAIEQVSPFVAQTLQDIQRIIETNLTAPMALTRLALPGLLQRGSGHIVNIASIAGKKAPPYNAVYGATKAGLIEWTGALRGELEGTGVSASVVCPGFIAEAGMFVDHYGGQPAPWLLGTSPPEAVARAVVQAIRQDALEVLVTPRPARLGLAIYALWPGLGNRFLQWAGVTKLFRRAVEG